MGMLQYLRDVHSVFSRWLSLRRHAESRPHKVHIYLTPQYYLSRFAVDGPISLERVPELLLLSN